MGTFFEMGGYAAYVWPAYGLATLVVVGLLTIVQFKYIERKVHY